MSSTALIPTPSATPVIEALREVVAIQYALVLQTHLCHWNVRGPSFFSLHTAFEAQYTELFAATDEVAERIRALGALAPGGLARLAELAEVPEIEENADSERMVAHLIGVHERLVRTMARARDLAGELRDVQTEDLMVGRIQVHEKTIWMLRSFLA
jgi:starvation-inducible DNA-binding protein